MTEEQQVPPTNEPNLDKSPETPNSSPNSKDDPASATSDPTKTSSDTQPPTQAARVMIPVVFGILCGVLSGWLIESYRNSYKSDVEMPNVAPESLTPAQMQEIFVGQQKADSKNITLCTLLMGLVLGGVISPIPGLLTRQMPQAVVGLVSGVALGAGFGYLAGLLGTMFNQWFFAQFIETLANFTERESYQLYNSVLTHCVVFLVLGFAIVVSVSLGSSRSMAPKLLLAVCIVALAWGAFFPFVMLLIAPDEGTRVVLPGGTTSVYLWTCTYSVLIAVSVAMITTRPRESARNVERTMIAIAKIEQTGMDPVT